MTYPSKQRKPRKVYSIWSKESKKRYQELHEKHWAVKYPSAYKDGLYTFNDLAGKKASNRLTDLICNFLEWSGHEANRVDVKGTAVIDKKAKPKFDVVSGKVQYQQKINFIGTKTKKGTGDIAVKLVHPKHPYGVPWEIEIKIRDSQSEAQEKREEELKSKGLWYDVMHNMDEFFDIYDQKVELLNK